MSALKTFVIAAFLLLVGTSWAQEELFKSGDIIFQSSDYGQSKVVQLVTHSPMTHVGILFKTPDGLQVLEAIHPVVITPFKKWIRRDAHEKYWVMRLKQGDLDSNQQAQLRQEGEKLLGIHYDLKFLWSDHKLYCSELVWKLYKKVLNITLSEPEVFADLDWTHVETKAMARQRYGNHIPMQEKIVTPAALFHSKLLKQVWPLQGTK